MKRFLILTAALLASACGQEQNYPAGEAEPAIPDARITTHDVREDAARAPGVSMTAAPGVAFDYRYAFRLPGESISPVLERHAAACEKLGVQRCRITGMRYRLINERDIQASLAFKLDPTIARQFGKEGIAAVEESEGMLVDSEITGTDAGAQISSANREEAQLLDQIEEAEGSLQRGGITREERSRLTSRVEELRRLLAAVRGGREQSKESLATTPMVFTYGSGRMVPGFDNRNPILAALERSGDMFVSAIAAMVLMLGVVLPWALLIALVVYLFRRLGGRLPRMPQPSDIA